MSKQEKPQQTTLDGSEYIEPTSDDWETPMELFKQLDDLFHFTLDPCCYPETAKCETFFTPKENGLKQSWAGHRVFLNMPYSDIESWVIKAKHEVQDKAELVVALIPAWTDRTWYSDYVEEYAAVYFLRGRVKFLLNGKKKKSPSFGSMIVIWTKQTVNDILLRKVQV